MLDVSVNTNVNTNVNVNVNTSGMLRGGNRYVEGEPRTFGYLMFYETFHLLTIG